MEVFQYATFHRVTFLYVLCNFFNVVVTLVFVGGELGGTVLRLCELQFIVVFLFILLWVVGVCLMLYVGGVLRGVFAGGRRFVGDLNEKTRGVLSFYV